MFNEPDHIRDEKDWIESTEFQNVIIEITGDNKYKKSETSDLNYTTETIQDWFLKRTNEIESLSGLVDVALSFCEIGIANGCKNMNTTVENLRILYTLTYECKSETYYSLEYISTLNDIEKLCLIMSYAHDVQSELFTKNLQDWFIPFISRRPTLHVREKLLRDYLIKVSKEELFTCLKLVNLISKMSSTAPINSLKEINIISIIVECIYTNENPEQVDISYQLINEITMAAHKSNELLNTNLANKPSNKLNSAQIWPELGAEQKQQIKLVQEHLRACKLFRKYGIIKTLAYVKDSTTSDEKCRDAFVKLTWFASKRATHLKMSEWIELKKDLKELQKSVYANLINDQECDEIYLTSILGSRNTDNIDFAAEMLKDLYIVDKENAINLALKAAQEYFNAASSHLDPDMGYANDCLNLIISILVESSNLGSRKNQNNVSILKELGETDTNVKKYIELVEKERELIQAMQLIFEFDYNILPVQVRLKEDRTDIIKDILKKNEHAYKEYDKVLLLSSYLHIKPSLNKKLADGDCIEFCDIKLLIAECALENKNFNVLNHVCKSLISLNYGPAWLCTHKLAINLCKNLIEQHRIAVQKTTNDENCIFEAISNHKFIFSSLTSSIYSSKEKTIVNLIEIEKLLSFVLTHCKTDLIEMILYQKIKVEKARDNLEQSINEESYDQNESDSENVYLKFENLSSNFFSMQNSVDYEQNEFFSNSAKLKYLLKNLKAIKIESDESKFISYLNQLTCLDCNLAMAYLLECEETTLKFLNQNLTADHTISFEFVLYLLGLNIISSLSKESFDMSLKSYIYYLKPSTLNEYIELIDSNEQQSLKNKHIELLRSLFKKVNKLYTEFNQNNTLKNLELGIDLKRFETDETYKHETILGLSMDVSTFQLACSLAKFYSFDTWKIYMSFTEYLIPEHESAGVPFAKIESKIAPLLPVLKSRMAEFKKNMVNNVLPFINGNDIDKLILFYGFIDDEESQNHAKCLKKLKSINLHDLNYKDLLNEPLTTIEPYLDDTNIKFFEKLITKLPIKSEYSNPSKINVTYCLKKFWQEIDALISSDQQAWTSEKTSLFFENFENLSESIRKLDFESDFMFFVKELTLSRKSLSLLSVHIRKEIIKKIGKFLKKDQVKLNDEKIDKLNKELHEIQTHFKQIENLEKIFQKVNKIDIKSTSYIKKFDFDLGTLIMESNKIDESKTGQEEATKIESILVEMFFDGYSIELINDVIKLFELKETNIKKLIKLCLNKVCVSLKGESDKTKQDTKWDQSYSKLQGLLDTISNHLNLDSKSNEAVNSKSKKKSAQTTNLTPKIINEEDVMECMRTFCNDQQIDINLRLMILEDLKKSVKNIRDEDLILLLVYKTNAILENCDRFDKKVELVDSNDIENESKRSDLIAEFIELSNDSKHCLALVNFLKIWPEFNSENEQEKPWNKVIIKLILNNHPLSSIIAELKPKNTIKDKDLEFIKSSLQSQEDWSDASGYLKLSYLKLCLQLNSVGSFKKFIESKELDFLDSVNKISKIENFEAILNDKELMDLLIEDKRYLQILNTSLYFIFSKYVLKNESKQTLNEIAKSLRQNGYIIEAGKLFIETEDLEESYRTISVSLKFIEKLSERN